MRATPEGTGRYAARHPELPDFYRSAQGLRVSSLGIGSYLGRMSADVDEGYEEAMSIALRSGINFIDTSLNYRHQRSERAIGRALKSVPDVSRDEVVICTKAGYLVPDAVPPGLAADDVVGGMHCLAPSFLRDQLERSRANLGVEAVDVFYLHNPETQLQYVAEDVFYARIRGAFETAEAMAADRSISFYGVATWPGFRAASGQPGLMSLPRLEGIAREIAGDSHRFRFIQLPFNLAMTEGVTLENQVVAGKTVSTAEAALELGVTVIASATLLQARLPDPTEAIRFTQKTAGIAVALVGMSRPEHVTQNIKSVRHAQL